MNAQTQAVVKKVGSVALAAAVVATACVLAGCNTTEGVGKDLESAGEGIQDAAQKAKD